VTLLVPSPEGLSEELQMQMSTVVFRGIRRNDVLEADIRRRVHRLRSYCPSLISVRVLLGRHRRHGNCCFVRIDLADEVPQPQCGEVKTRAMPSGPRLPLAS
jgi:hypothetical protein